MAEIDKRADEAVASILDGDENAAIVFTWSKNLNAIRCRVDKDGRRFEQLITPELLRYSVFSAVANILHRGVVAVVQQTEEGA